MIRKTHVGAGLLVAALFVCPSANAAPTFAGQVPAEEVHTRGGIGHVMAKIRAGGPVRIAYFGGSITEQDGWRRLSREWLQAKYPGCTFVEIAAAIGGTGSGLGVYRFGQDVLAKNPDLVFVEFATNDASQSPAEIWKNFDGIIRQAWQQDPEIDFVFAYTITAAMMDDYGKGLCPRAASAMEQLADYYGIPSVCFGPRVAADVMAGKLVMSIGEVETAVPTDTPDRDKVIEQELAKEGKMLFSKDGVHPALPGHGYYLESLKVAWAAWEGLAAVDHAPKLASAFSTPIMEKAKMVPIDGDMLSGTWRSVGAKETNGNFASRFGGAPWLTTTPGSKLRFRFKGTSCQIYDLLGPACGQLWVTVDGVRKAQPVARFDRYCTYYRVGTLGVFTGADAEHEIEIELDAAQPDRTLVLVQGVKPEELTGAKYTGTEWYAGRLMLVGDVVPPESSPVLAENVLMDAAIEAYAVWPKDAEKAMGGGWATTAATLADVAAVRAPGRLEVNAGEERLALVSEQTVSLGDRVKALVFASDLACDGYDVGQFPSVETDWKGAVLVGVADGVAAYYGLCRFGDRNVWTRLDGATPPTRGSVRLTLTYRRTAEGLTVEYQANGVTLTVGNRAYQPVVGDNVFKGFVCGGCGTLETMMMSKVPGTGFLIQLCARD